MEGVVTGVHGTRAMYVWHMRTKVPACAPCREANVVYMKAYNQALRRLHDAHRDEFDRYFTEGLG